MTPDEVEAVAAQALCRDAGGGLHRASASSTICITRRDGRALRRPRRDGRRASPPRRRQTGIGLTLLPVFYAHAGFGGAPPQRGAAAVHHRSRRLRARSSRQSRAPSPASTARSSASRRIRLRAVDAGGTGARSARSRADGPIHIHVAEQVKEVEDCLAWSGARPVEWLLDHAAVDRALVPRSTPRT